MRSGMTLKILGKCHLLLVEFCTNNLCAFMVVENGILNSGDA